MFVVDTRSKYPIFEQLKKQILEFITIGVLSPNDKLPSVRALASQLGINPNTVSKAYQELEELGYLYTEKGKGCFIADNQSDELIKEEKLKEFRGVVLTMKKHKLPEEKLANIVKEIYKEGN